MGIDLNVVDEAPPPAVCRDLWHACAGPVVALPRRGSLVVYLPQAHLAAAGGGGGDVVVDMPRHVVCRVADVELCVSTLPYWDRVGFLLCRRFLGLECFDDGSRMTGCRLMRRRTKCICGWLALVAEGEVKCCFNPWVGGFLLLVA
jgi:hypothetical protein